MRSLCPPLNAMECGHSRSDGPDPAIVARNREPSLLVCAHLEVVLAVQQFGVAARPRERERHMLLTIREVQHDQREVLHVRTREDEHPLRLIAIPIVVKEIIASLELPMRLADAGQLTHEAQHATSIVIIEVLPWHRAEQADACESPLRHSIVGPELLALPEEGNASSCEQCNQIRLNLIPARTVGLVEQGIVTADDTEVSKKP